MTLVSCLSVTEVVLSVSCSLPPELIEGLVCCGQYLHPLRILLTGPQWWVTATLLEVDAGRKSLTGKTCSVG